MQLRPLSAAALRRFLLVCLLPAGFAACDRHSAGEPPESYGHGSSRKNSYESHAIDSSGPRHYSDSNGADADHKHGHAAEAAQPEPAPAGKRLNPGGN